ncbi:hypothetical protein LTR70_006523 [Exophiala xenobiotica]|uniref:GH16 domain-containing protein n=1 Tax=Lithohypha guttulata TaxID=1690604 RepID=A0ABR0K945_9EURO|nr:hypothetical protein LTR24_006036 [Lithohypha guttulata]KAK5315881.1 hypothetical protein LTR70_006523 [Exophiala xenobiotica]
MTFFTTYPYALRALLLGSLAIGSVDASRKRESQTCGAYMVSGPDPGYFQHYHFSDFGSIPSVQDNDFTAAPPLVTSAENREGQPSTSSFFNQTTWQEYWSIHDDVHKPDSLLPSIYSDQNVFIARNSTRDAETDTYLTLRASRPGAFVSTAEIELNVDQVLYASLRARLRVLPNGLSNLSAPTAGPAEYVADPDTGSDRSHPVDSGAVLGLFFYHNDTQESDIEILTRDPINQIHYTNQPDYDDSAHEEIAGASTEVTMPHDYVMTEWLDHRIDWFDGVSRWYINGDLVLDKTINTPSTPSTVFMNLWSNGGSWSGNMSVGAQVYVGVQYVELAYNTSQSVGSNDQGKESCYIDNDGFNKSTTAPDGTFTSVASSSRLCGVDNLYRVTALVALVGIGLSVT